MSEPRFPCAGCGKMIGLGGGVECPACALQPTMIERFAAEHPEAMAQARADVRRSALRGGRVRRSRRA